MTDVPATASTAAARAPVKTWLVTGPRAGARETAIAGLLQPGVPSAIILEGLSDGGSTLVFDDAGSAAGVSTPHDVQNVVPNVMRIAPGCLHCSGNLVLRVTLNRLLRHPPAQLYISLASAEHLEQLRTWLSSPPYNALLVLQPDIAA